MAGKVTGSLPFESPRYEVVPTNVYNSLVGGTDKLHVDAVEPSGDSVGTDNLEKDYDGTGLQSIQSLIARAVCRPRC